MMKVTCALCDLKKDLDEEIFLAKRLRNNPIKMYICKECYERIKENRLIINSKSQNI